MAATLQRHPEQEGSWSSLVLCSAGKATKNTGPGRAAHLTGAFCVREPLDLSKVKQACSTVFDWPLLFLWPVLKKPQVDEAIRGKEASQTVLERRLGLK